MTTGLIAAAAFAQPGTDLLRTHLPPTRFEEGSLADVTTRAAEENRLIVIFIRNESDPATKAMDERVWRNPSLAAHIRWHSLACQVDCVGSAGLVRMVGLRERDCPAVVVARVVNGKFEVLKKMPTLRNEFMEAIRANKGRTIGLQIEEGDIPDIYPGTLTVLQESHMALEALRARDPLWMEEHDKRNPEPSPPPHPDPIHEVTDSDAPAVSDPEPLSGAPNIAGWIDVYDRLNEARESAAEGDVYLATGLYTWLWEKGEKADPAFRAAKRSVVAEEMRQLALKSRSARDRFRRLKAQYDERLLWSSYETLGDWFLLNAVVSDEAETVAYLDLFINDLDEGSMLPDCDKFAYRLMVGRGEWNDPWDLGERPARPAGQLGSETRFKPVSIPVTRRAVMLVREDAGGRSAGMAAEDREKIDAFRDVFAVDECARLHAACLRAGRESDAWQIASALLAARRDPLARLALVAAAVAAGEVRPRHAQLLKEAETLGSPHPVLVERVTAALKNPSK